jgi:hypothetical protein
MIELLMEENNRSMGHASLSSKADPVLLVYSPSSGSRSHVPHQKGAKRMTLAEDVLEVGRDLICNISQIWEERSSCDFLG